MPFIIDLPVQVIPNDPFTDPEALNDFKDWTMDLIQSVWNDPDKPYGDDEIVHWVLQDLYNMCNKDGMNFREILDMIRHLEEILEITGAVPLLERFSEERLLEAFDVVETGTEQTS